MKTKSKKKRPKGIKAMTKHYRQNRRIKNLEKDYDKVVNGLFDWKGEIMNIRLFRKHLYNVENEQGMLESHFKEYYLNIGYKNQICFISIEKVDLAEIITYADLVWKSKF